MKQKRKLGRKLLGFLLALVLVVGLMPGMALTANAQCFNTGKSTYTVTFSSDGTSVEKIVLNFAYGDDAHKAGTYGDYIGKTYDATYNFVFTKDASKCQQNTEVGEHYTGWGSFADDGITATAQTVTATITSQNATYGVMEGTFTLDSFNKLEKDTQYYALLCANWRTMYWYTAEYIPIKLEPRRVTFDTDGGSPVPEVQCVNKGNTITKPTDPTKDNKRFLGWYLNDEEFDFNTGITENITLCAKWENLPATVTYQVVGGTWSDGTTAEKTETVQSGSKPASVPTGMKASSGYTGGSWDTNPAETTITEAKTFTYTFTTKQAATVTKAPTAKNPTYNGQAQALVEAGTAEGGTMVYALGENATTAPADNLYTTSIPAKTDAGTYCVWYKAVGDDDHFDSAEECLTVTITEADKADDGNKDDKNEADIKTETRVEENAPETKAENLTPDLAKNLITEDELKQLEEGTTLLLYLDVKNIDETVSDEDKELTQKATKEVPEGAQVGMYLDISLFKKLGENDPVKVTNTGGKMIKAVLEVPENLKPAEGVIRTFYVVRIHDGNVEIIAQSTDMTIPVESDLFSTYSLIYSDVPENEGYVSRVYRYLLERPGDADGVASWENALAAKEITAAQVIEGIIYSDEYIKKNGGQLNKDVSDEVFIDKSFLTVLGRKADTEGKQHFADELKEGCSRKYVLAQIVDSDEFKKICNDNGYDAGRITLTDEDKKPDADNRQVDVEKVRDFVRRLYNVVLEREPEGAGYEYWVDMIATRKQTPQWVATVGFFSSDEYLEKHKSAEDFITDCYAALMDRTPDEEGGKYWQEKLAGGMSRTRVTTVGFGQSKEFADILRSYGLK